MFNIENIKTELPSGWNDIISQMCEDIEAVLQNSSDTSNFKFINLGVQSGELHAVYTANSTEELDKLIAKYEYISQYICSKCGEVASYRVVKDATPYCTDCWKDHLRHEKVVDLPFSPFLQFTYISKDGYTTEELDCSDIWDRYINRNYDPWDDYDWCYECTGYGDDYSVDDNGDLVSNCSNCPHNKNREDYDEEDIEK